MSLFINYLNLTDNAFIINGNLLCNNLVYSDVKSDSLHTLHRMGFSETISEIKSFKRKYGEEKYSNKFFYRYLNGINKTTIINKFLVKIL